MTAHDDPRTMFECIIALNSEAFQAGHYNTAYHLLAAALHAVQEEETPEWLFQVKTIAENQLLWIDIDQPEYEHSTKSAATRGQSSIFRLLAKQAHAKCLVYQQERQKPRRRLRLPEPRNS
jgi:hypothetical protein